MLTERQGLILQHIIEIYEETDEPVGSKALLERSDLNVSSATIRNEMAKLEKMGLLEKTHTSSGRIPSIEGYRYYIDHQVNFSENQLSAEDKNQVIDLFNHKILGVTDAVEQATNLLADLTSFTAISFGPELTGNFQEFRVVPVTSDQLVLLLITSQGHVESQMVKIDPNKVQATDIAKVVRIINAELSGLNLVQVYQRLQTDLPHILKRYGQAHVKAHQSLLTMLNIITDNQFFVSGELNLMDYLVEETNNTTAFKKLANFLTDTDQLQEISESNQQFYVKVGQEVTHKKELDNIALIVSSFALDEEKRGKLALIGPSNMSYSRNISLMVYLSHLMSRRLSRLD